MPRAEPNTLSTLVLRSPAAFAAAAGVDVDGALRQYGLDRGALTEPWRHVSALAAVGAWAELARRSGDPQFGLRLAQREPVGTYDILGYIVRCSPDFEHGIAQFMRYQRLLGDARRFQFRVEGTAAIFQHELSVRAPDVRHLVEHDLALVTLRVREFVRDDWCPRVVGFRHAAPANTSLHDELFGTTVRFGQPTDSLRFDRATLAAPMRAPDPYLADLLRRSADEALRRMPPPDAFAARVRGALAELLNAGEVSAADVSRRLHMSPRTLQRRLADEGTTLREAVDAVRRELAEEYLAQHWISLEEIGLLLGFSDASSFTRAFRRWTGRPPGDYRRERARPAADGTDGSDVG